MDSNSGRPSAILTSFLAWLPQAFLITVMCGLVYLGIQQTWRMSANDPQVQIAQDDAARLANGVQPQELVLGDRVDISRSLSPFVVVYGASGNVITATANLNGAVPPLPDGVLDATRIAGEDRITWQPEPGVRLATIIEVVNSGNGGFVLAGRSLRETEDRIDNLGKIALLAWGIGLVGALITTWVAVVMLRALSKSRS